MNPVHLVAAKMLHVVFACLRCLATRVSKLAVDNNTQAKIKTDITKKKILALALLSEKIVFQLSMFP